MGRPKGSLNKKGKKPAPKKKTKEEIRAEKAKEKANEIKFLKSKIVSQEEFRKLDEYDKKRDYEFRRQLERLSGEKILRKKVKKPPAPPAKSNPTGRAKIGDRKLDTGHSKKLKQGSINYHKCAREKGKCGKKYSGK